VAAAAGKTGFADGVQPTVMLFSETTGAQGGVLETASSALTFKREC